jgi:quinol monooxygenase YgiN
VGVGKNSGQLFSTRTWTGKLLYLEEARVIHPEPPMERHMILATIRMTVPPQKSSEALRIFRSMTERSRDERGCLSCHVYGDLQETDVLMLEEVWRSGEDLERHLRSQEYLSILLAMEMADKKPEIRFDTISSSTGIEMIEKARGYTK